MFRPSFTLRAFLITAVLVGAVGIPQGYNRYLEWHANSEVIQVSNTDAGEIATVLGDVYRDRVSGSTTGGSQQPISISVDTLTNSLRVSAEQEAMNEMRALVSILDARSFDTDVSGSGTSIPADPETVEHGLRRVLDPATSGQIAAAPTSK